MPSNTVKFSPEKSPKDKRQHGLGITIFSGAILVVIIVTFIGAPIVSKAGNEAFEFGSYDGLPIEYIQGNYFARQVESFSSFYEQFNFGSDVGQTRQLVWSSAFRQAALQVGLKREAERAGIIVTNDAIGKALRNISAYQENGVYEPRLYESLSKADQASVEAGLGVDLLVGRYSEDQTSGVLLSSATEKFIASLAYPQRKFSYVTFTEADYPLDQVKDYAQKNKALFRTINLSRITVTASEAEAKKVHEEAAKGTKPFADLAKQYSKDPLAESGGALNPRAYHELKTEITKVENLDKIYALPKDAVTEIIANGSNWTFYKVVEASQEADLSALSTLDAVRSYLVSNDRGLVEDYLERKAQEFQVSAMANFDNAVKAAGKTVQKTEWVALNFGNLDLFTSLSVASKDSLIQNQSANEDFFKKAFRTAEKGITAPILSGTSVLVLRVDEVKNSPAAGDTAVSIASVQSRVASDRQSAVQQFVMTSPRFKDGFQAQFTRLFPN